MNITSKMTIILKRAFSCKLFKISLVRVTKSQLRLTSCKIILIVYDSYNKRQDKHEKSKSSVSKI